MPGGFCEINEDLEETARRELEEETGLKGVPMELINTWGEVWRDPRSRVITASYLALVDDSIEEPVAGDDAAEAVWFNVDIGIKGRAEIEVDGKKKIRSLYNLNMYGLADQVCSAVVSVDENAEGLLKERQFKVIDSSNLAFDHARFIVDGLLHLQRALQ